MSEHRMQECPIHGLVKFSKHRNGNVAPRFRCTKCAADATYRIVKAKKERAYLEFGSACVVCGYDRCKAALEWHHLDPNGKEIEPKKAFSRSWERIKEELKKCVLLCANCHREVHHNALVV